MILENGDMWSVFGKTDIFMITTNPIERRDGAIVMGRGIAYQAKERYPTIPYAFAKSLRKNKDNHIGRIGDYDGQEIWWFMVKKHWKSQADIELIDASCAELNTWLSFVSKSIRVDLNFPGIGNGGLERKYVLPIVSKLPDSVHIWEYK